MLKLNLKYFTALLFGFLQIISSSKLQVVGILSIPKILDESQPYNYQSAAVNPSYVKWLEASGAETLVIHPWNTSQEIAEILTKVNGIVLQGSLYQVDLYKANPYLDRVLDILEALSLKENGNKIPLIGIDDGFVLLHYVMSGKIDHTENYEKYNRISNLEFDFDRVKTTRLFSILTEKDLSDIRTHALTFNLNRSGISPSAYQENKKLREFFRITSVAKDENGKLFIASVEAYNHPIYAVQFRPDAISFLKNSNLDLPNSTEAIRAARAIGNFFVQDCKDNNKNILQKSEYDKFSLIDSYILTPTYDNIADGFVYSFDKPTQNFKH